MNKLFSYVSLIKNTPESEFIVDRNFTEKVVEDDWSITNYLEQIVTFKNGVIIKQCMEKDVGVSNPDIVCEECFISYEILKEPESYSIMPKRKTFSSHCQEAFWLKINSVQSS